jgi:HAD superfamily hydrolase (TIGR01457 family)
VLARGYDALFLDLDGVVYRGDQVLPGVADVLGHVRADGTPVLFLTNNSSKTPEQVADKLRSMGVPSSPGEVLTSGVATAAMLQREGAAGSTAFVIGERGVREALEGIGVKLVDGEPERVDFVVVGWDRAADYGKLRTAGLLVQRGARLIATNADASYPAPDGLWPGAGALLAAVTTTTGAVPTVVGKPARPLFEAGATMTGVSNPLVVGDRLDTDISGAAGMGWDSLLVLTGATRPADLPRARDLPTYVGRDLSILRRSVPAARFAPATADEVNGIGSLLASAGLTSDGIERRLDHTLVSRDGDGVPATACLEPVGHSGILRSVAVRADLRGSGLGMLVSAAALRQGRARGIVTFALFTETAAHFFELLGFQKTERSDLPEEVRTSRHATEECARSAVPMVLTLEV